MVVSSQGHVPQKAGYAGHAPYRCQAGLSEEGSAYAPFLRSDQDL